MTAACPACPPGPAQPARPGAVLGDGPVTLAVPGVRCASCIGAVEGALATLPGVRAARVNLARRRVRVDAPGLAPEALIRAMEGAGYEAHELDEAALGDADPEGRALLARIAVSGFAMMNVMVLSVAVWSGAAGATGALFTWVSAAIALPAAAVSAQPFLVSAWGALARGRLNMDVPIALAILLACASSLAALVRDTGEHAWFEAALSLTFFLLAGRYLEHRARAAARSAAAELAALEIPRATVLEGDARRTVPVADIRPGMRVWLPAGTRAPVDGVAEGPARMDRAAITGESLPVEIGAGAPVAAGEMPSSGPLVIRATARAEDSTIRRLAALVEIAEGGRHRYAALAERAAGLYAPLVHILAALAFAGWWMGTADAWRAVGVATAVLIITCPCALGLAAPAVTAATTGRLFGRGILLKDGTALERLAEVDTVILDKTGTLTTGALRATRLDPEAASVAAALAGASAHPASRALLAALAGIEPAPVEAVTERAGDGVSGIWRGAPVFLGRGPSGTELRLPGRIVPIALDEMPRPGAADLTRRLRAMGLRVVMATGDAPERAARLAAALGIDDVRAGLTPEEKARLAADLGAHGARVLMVGDGINDAAALAGAHVSAAPASALDAARAAADAVLLSPDLTELAGAIAQARTATRRIHQNFAIAGAYNLVAVPLALAGLATPLMAALAMSSSSVTVVANALRPS